MAPTLYPMIALGCGVSLLQGCSAWLPVSPRAATTGRVCKSRPPQVAAGDAVGGGGRPDLVSMKRSFETSMDNKLIMEYVTELRARKALLLKSLEETGGIITDEIYRIMEELALVNPSSGCGAGSDKGKSHYCAMLRGHWIAASTIVPNVPYVFGPGEKAGTASSAASTDGDGPTCTLGELVSVVSEATGGTGDAGGTTTVEYDDATPVRPLRTRISALMNTVKDGEMPTVVAVAGFSPAADGATTEDGAVRGRGKWGVMGGYHLRWEFDTMNVDLGGDRIVKANGGGAGAGAGAGGGARRDVYEFFLDQNMMILAWKDAPNKEDAVVFVRDEVPR
eukprot:g11480.t1